MWPNVIDNNIVWCIDSFLDLNLYSLTYLHYFLFNRKYFKKLSLKIMAMLFSCCFSESIFKKLPLLILLLQVQMWNKISTHKLKYNWQIKF
jgi:hypothetical protein